MRMSKIECANCRHSIDDTAKLCPYCDADPRSGRKIDAAPLIKEEFATREVGTGESVMEFFRARQGVVITVAVIAAFFLLYGLHAFVTKRNQSAVNAAPAVPLTEVADLSNQADQVRELPMPPLPFQFDGKSQTMRTFVVEPGAVAPPPPPPTSTQSPSGTPAATPAGQPPAKTPAAPQPPTAAPQAQ
jgi:hypothetical protein